VRSDPDPDVMNKSDNDDDEDDGLHSQTQVHSNDDITENHVSSSESENDPETITSQRL
jgi:hypothetical protein